MREQAEDKARVPLKTILQNFLNHVDYLESRKRGRDDAYEQEFQVRLLSVIMGPKNPCNICKLTSSRSKNHLHEVELNESFGSCLNN